MSSQLALDLSYRPALGADNFFISVCNEEAVGWLDLWPDWPAPLLTIYGPAGSGKSHLANVWRERSGAQVLAPYDMTATSARDIFSDTKACVVDEMNGSFDEESLFHLYNVALEENGHILVLAKNAPSAWPLKLADLKSRLLAAPAVALGAPDDALLGALLVKLFFDRQIDIGPDVLSYVLRRMERSFEAARQLVRIMDQLSLAERRSLTVPLARKALEKFSAK